MAKLCPQAAMELLSSPIRAAFISWMRSMVSDYIFAYRNDAIPAVLIGRTSGS